MASIDFSATCLYASGFFDIDFDHFIQTISGIGEQENLSAKVQKRKDDDLLILKVGNSLIEIDMLHQPAGRTSFENVLLLPNSEQATLDFSALVDTHKEHILVTVSPHKRETSAQMELRLKLLHMTSLYLCTYSKPEMIHWTQSDQIYTGQQYLSFIEDELPKGASVPKVSEPKSIKKQIQAATLQKLARQSNEPNDSAQNAERSLRDAYSRKSIWQHWVAKYVFLGVVVLILLVYLF